MLKNFFVKNWPFALVIILGISVAWPLFVSGYFSHQDDLQVMRIFEMKKCFSDFQIPCRWVPDMGYGNGFPLFNYYGPFPYYLGGLLSFIFSYITSAKILFFIALVLGGVGMYFFVKDLWGKLAGATAAVLYLFAPYKALDIYVRGAVSEAFALALIPFVFLFGLNLAKSRGVKDFIAFSLFLAAFLATHNIMTMIFIPVILLWLSYCLYLNKGRSLTKILLGFGLGLGLSAFFTIPAFFERNLIHTEALTRFALDFRANFVTLKQLFIDRFWGYGLPSLEPQSQLSFQLGWPHWWLAILAGPLALLKKKKEDRVLVAATLILFLGSVLMMHNKSAFIWERIGLLKYFQFPWRFLSLSVFTSSILGGYLVSTVAKARRLWVALGTIVLTAALNWNYFKPGEFYPNLTDAEKLSGEAWEIQQKGAILDYLPKAALDPKEKAPDAPFAQKGSAVVANFQNHSNRWSFTADAESESYLVVPVFSFPIWRAKVDGKEVPINPDNYLGRIGIILGTGEHIIEGSFTNTPVRILANGLTLVSLLGLVLVTVYGKTRKILE